MPYPEHRSFDPDASLEELAGVGKNRRFDEAIDDEEFEDIQGQCTGSLFSRPPALLHQSVLELFWSSPATADRLTPSKCLAPASALSLPLGDPELDCEWATPARSR